jgi:DNA mismatch repair ATPase MutS
MICLPLNKAVGKLDAILSIADSMSRSSNPFCFAEFDESNEVKLELEDYWSLLIRRDNVKTNSLSIGPEDPHIMIIRGGNTYGKTTAIKSIGICEYLAGTIGVVPAKTCRLSKPAQVLTSIEETDSPGRFSKAEAQVESLLNLLEKASKSEQPHVLIIDEFLESVDAPTLAAVLPLAFGKNFPALSSKIIGLIVAQKLGNRLQRIAQKDPKNYQLLYVHEDHTV